MCILVGVFCVTQLEDIACADESAKTITVLEYIHNLAQQKLFSLAHRNLKVCFRSAFFVHVKHRLWELLIWEFYKAYMSSCTTNETRGLSL